MQTFYNSWWFLLMIATVLDTEHCFGMAQPPMCGKYDPSLPRPVAVRVSSLTTRSVTITVTLSPGYYDVLYVYVYSGQVAVSSGSVNLGGQRLDTETSQTYTVTLSSLLTLGMTYTINALITSGTACSYPATNPASAMARQAQAPSAPKITDVIEVSGGIQVSWTLSSGQIDKIIVTLLPLGGVAAITHNVPVSVNPPHSATIPASKLVKGQNYSVSLKAEYKSVQSASSSPHTVTLTPATPKAVRIETISVTSVILTVTFRAGGYSSIEAELTPSIGDPVTWPKRYGYLVLVNGNDTQMVSLTNLTQQLMGGELYRVTVRTVSGTKKSGPSPPSSGIRIGPLPVNVSVLSATSRSVLLTWQRDNNVNSYRLLVSQDQTCVQDVYFAAQVPFPTSSCARVKTEALDVNAVDVTYNITGLLPYSGYQIALYVTFVAGSEPSRLNVMTDAEVPSEVPITQVTVGGDKNVSVCWSPPEPFPGPTNYTLTLVDMGQDPRPDRQLITQDQLCVQPYMNNLCGQFTDLEEYWLYRIRLWASTRAGGGNTSESQEFRTPEAVPGQVTNLQFIAPEDSLSNVAVTWGPPKPRDRNANITGFILKYQNKVSDNVTSFNIPWSQSDNEVYSKEVQVEPGETYNFSLVAVSKSFKGEVLYAEYLAPRGPPPVPTECVICLEVSSEDSGPRSTHTFQVNLRADFFTDDTNGHIVDYGLIVTQTGSVKAESTSQRLETASYKNYTNWREAKSKDFTTPYRATPIGWSLQHDVKRRSKRETFQYTVGKDENCTEAVDTFCNGPLKPGTKYSVKAFSCTHGGCTETDYINGYGTVRDVLQEADSPSISGQSVTEGVVIAVSVSCAVLLAIVIVLIVVLFRRARHQNSEDRTNSESRPDSDCPVPFTPMVKQPDDDLQTSNPIPVTELFQAVEELHKDSNFVFSRQYLWLKERSPKLPATTASLEANMLKNRYVDILPFDDTRVKLLPVQDEEESDYINASYIPGYHSKREYIAAQGPLQTTIDDFWRMIWEQKITIIVMLTKVKEKDKVKCEQYWPDEDGKHRYGDVVVERLSRSNLNTYELREFTITKDTGVRKIKQFQFLMWPDFGVSNCEDMVNFLQDVRSHVRPNTSGPLLIHCSAGVGRSGTFIAVDQIRENIYDSSAAPDLSIDFYGIVLSMRRHRPRMVQTEAQYIFIHDCVCEVVRRKMLADYPDDEHIYYNQGLEIE